MTLKAEQNSTRICKCASMGCNHFNQRLQMEQTSEYFSYSNVFYLFYTLHKLVSIHQEQRAF